MGISFRSDTNKWIVRVRNKKLNIDYTKSFSSKTLAKKDELRVKAEIESGTFMKQNENMTFKEASDLYMQNVVERKCRESTKEGYKGYLKNHILPYFGEKTLCSISKFDIEAFINQLNNKKCKHIKSTSSGIIKELTNRNLSNETINHIIFLCGAHEIGDRSSCHRQPTCHPARDAAISHTDTGAFLGILGGLLSGGAVDRAVVDRRRARYSGSACADDWFSVYGNFRVLERIFLCAAACRTAVDRTNFRAGDAYFHYYVVVFSNSRANHHHAFCCRYAWRRHLRRTVRRFGRRSLCV